MAFLGDLPAGLSSRLTRFLHTKDLCKLPIFQDCERGFIAALSNRMKMINMAPMESIFKVGDAGKEMFIIKKVRAKGGNGSWGACAYTWASSFHAETPRSAPSVKKRCGKMIYGRFGIMQPARRP